MRRKGLSPRLTVEELAVDCIDVRELNRKGLLKDRSVTLERAANSGPGPDREDRSGMGDGLSCRRTSRGNAMQPRAAQDARVPLLIFDISNALMSHSSAFGKRW